MARKAHSPRYFLAAVGVAAVFFLINFAPRVFAQDMAESFVQISNDEGTEVPGLKSYKNAGNKKSRLILDQPAKQNQIFSTSIPLAGKCVEGYNVRAHVAGTDEYFDFPCRNERFGGKIVLNEESYYLIELSQRHRDGSQSHDFVVVLWDSSSPNLVLYGFGEKVNTIYTKSFPIRGQCEVGMPFIITVEDRSKNMVYNGGREDCTIENKNFEKEIIVRGRNPYTLVLHQSDRHGQVSRVVKSLEFSHRAPPLELQTPRDNFLTSDIISFRAVCFKGNYVEFSYTIEGVPEETVMGAQCINGEAQIIDYEIPHDKDGAMEITAKIYNWEGGRMLHSSSVVGFKDSTEPQLSHVYPQKKLFTSGLVGFKGRCSLGEGSVFVHSNAFDQDFEIKCNDMNGDNRGDFQFFYYLTIADGRYHFSFQQIDQANNKSKLFRRKVVKGASY